MNNQRTTRLLNAISLAVLISVGIISTYIGAALLLDASVAYTLTIPKK